MTKPVHQNEMHDNPLVTLVVIAYNSAMYIIETLESIRTQTYANIELLISDDCSTDDTVMLCQKWIHDNGSRFARAELITSNINTGIPGTCNRGLRRASGEWIKWLAGDDTMIESAVENVIQFILRNKEVQILDSRVDIYNADLTVKYGGYDFHNSPFYHVDATAKEQLSMFIQRLDGQRLITTLGVFAKRRLIEGLGGFDNRYRLLEDAPLWYKVLRSGNKFYYLNKATVNYRRHDKAISNPDKNEGNEKLISDFRLNVDQFIWDHLYPHSDLLNKVNIAWLRAFSKLVLLAGNKGWFASMLWKTGNLTQPIRLKWFGRSVRRHFRTGVSLTNNAN